MTSSNSSPLARPRTSERSSPDSRPTTPAIGGLSVANVPWPRRRFARRRGGSSGSGCGIPFFPRVLVHLIGLGHGVAQRVAIQPDQGVALEAVPQGQELHPIASQLPRQPRRRDPLGEAAEDQEELGGTPLHA